MEVVAFPIFICLYATSQEIVLIGKITAAGISKNQPGLKLDLVLPLLRELVFFLFGGE